MNIQNKTAKDTSAEIIKDKLSTRKSSEATRNKPTTLIMSNNKKYENIIKKLKRLSENIQSPFFGSVKRHKFDRSIFNKYMEEFFIDFSEFFLDNFSSNFASNFSCPMSRVIYINSMKQKFNKDPISVPTNIYILNRLKKFVFGQEFFKKETQVDKFETPECSFCLKEMTLNQKGFLIPCGHMFHMKCALEFLSKRNNCFLCKYEFHEDDIEIEDITHLNQEPLEDSLIR